MVVIVVASCRSISYFSRHHNAWFYCYAFWSFEIFLYNILWINFVFFRAFTLNRILLGLGQPRHRKLTPRIICSLSYRP
jgi:hypothetical protein